MSCTTTLVDYSERSGWDDLAHASGRIFATPEWLGTWWQHFGGGKRPVVHRSRDPDGRLVAILPLYLWASFPFRVLRFAGHGPSDELGPICAPADRPLALASLVRLLDSERVDAFVGEDLASGNGWRDALGAQLLRQRPSPVLDIGGRSWDDFLASLRRETRQQVRAGERRLLRRGLNFRLTGSSRELSGDMDALFSLHAARFPRGLSQFGRNAKLQSFHREFAGLALRRGWLRLWLLESDGVPIAANYGFSFAGSYFFYNAGWRPEWSQRSVGRVLLLHTVRSAFEEGLTEYRFLKGGESYKYRFATGDNPVETIAMTRGPLPRAALASYHGLWRLRHSGVQRVYSMRRGRPSRRR